MAYRKPWAWERDRKAGDDDDDDDDLGSWRKRRHGYSSGGYGSSYSSGYSSGYSYSSWSRWLPATVDPVVRTTVFDGGYWSTSQYVKRTTPSHYAGAGRSGSLAGAEDALAASGGEAGRLSDVQALGAGIFSHLLGDPDRADREPPGWLAARLPAVLSDPEMPDLRLAVRGDPDLSAVATAALLRKLAQIPPEQGQGQGGGAARDALRAVIEAQSGLNDVVSGLGEPGQGMSLDGEGVARFVLASDPPPWLPAVLAIAGRVAATLRGTKGRLPTPPLEVQGVKRGGDLSAVLSSSLLGLNRKGLRALRLAELARGTALAWDRDSETLLGRGPMTVLVDQSGSMMAADMPMPTDVSTTKAQAAAMAMAQRKAARHGQGYDGPGIQRFAYAAGVVIGLVRACLRERRAVRVVGWDSLIRWSSDVRSVSDVGTLLQRLLNPAGGGTNLAPAIESSLLGMRSYLDNMGRVLREDHGYSAEHVADWQRAVSAGGIDPGARAMQKDEDLLIVTDGEAGRMPPSTVALLDTFKGNGGRVWGIMCHSSPGTLADVCDGLVSVDGRTTDLHAVGEMLSRATAQP